MLLMYVVTLKMCSLAYSIWILNRTTGAILIKLLESEIDFELRDILNHCLSKAHNIWHLCDLKACSNSRYVRFWHSQNLTNQEHERVLDLRLKTFHKHHPELLYDYVTGDYLSLHAVLSLTLLQTCDFAFSFHILIVQIRYYFLI